jgi:hypothetical protein
MPPLTPARLAALSPGDVLAVRVPGLPVVSLRLREDGSFVLFARGGIKAGPLLGLPAVQQVPRGSEPAQ